MCTSNGEITSLQSVLQRSFHHFDLSGSHFHFTLTMGSLISNQRIPIYCKSIEDIQPLCTRKGDGGHHISNNTGVLLQTREVKVNLPRNIWTLFNQIYLIPHSGETREQKKKMRE